MKYQNEINDVLTYGGYLSLGRCGWSLSIGEHKSSSGLGTVSSTLSGYYNIDNQPSDNLLQRCIDAGVPVVDSRDMSLEQAFEYIKGPLVHYSKNYSMDSDKISLIDFVKSKQHLGLKSYNIGGIS